MTISKQHRNHLLIALLAILLIGLASLAGFFVMRAALSDAEPDNASSLAIPGDHPPYNFDYSWAQNPQIAHAMGGILGDTYTNSYEAFLLNYNLGHRVFEVDFSLTEDLETVASHNPDYWYEHSRIRADDPFTLDNFLSTLAAGKYHPLTYQDVIDIMIAHPDIYLVTDSKYTDRERSDYEFTQIINYAKSTDPSVLDRIIVQIYHPEMLEWVMALYPWKSVIYTLYANPDWTPENVTAFAEASGVKFITIWYGSVKPEFSDQLADFGISDPNFTANSDGVLVPQFISDWKASGLQLAAYTVNDLTTERSLHSMGFDVIYTDFLIP